MISVIVPIYKVEEYLRRCVDSIINQTYRDLDIILVDDGSPDRCGEICDEYAKNDKRIRVFHTENRGISAARNLGIKEARGEYIGFIDSDDWIEPDMYEMLFNKAKDYNADLSMCGFWYEKETPFISNAYDIYYEGKDSLIALIQGKINSHIWNKIFRRTLFDSVCFPDNRYYEDVAIFHQILSNASKTVLISTPKYHYCQRENSTVKNYSGKHLLDYAYSYLDRFYFFKNSEEELFELNKEQILKIAAAGISRVWRWWYKCNRTEKREKKADIIELHKFTKGNIRFFNHREWPLFLRVSVIFMHSKRSISFAIMYLLNQLYRKNLDK